MGGDVDGGGSVVTCVHKIVDLGIICKMQVQWVEEGKERGKQGKKQSAP